MPLTKEQIQFIENLDKEVKQLLNQEDGEEALFLLLCDKMTMIGNIIDSTSHGEINAYCKLYTGFQRCMALIQQLALNISEETLSDSIE